MKAVVFALLATLATVAAGSQRKLSQIPVVDPTKFTSTPAPAPGPAYSQTLAPSTAPSAQPLPVLPGTTGRKLLALPTLPKVPAPAPGPAYEATLAPVTAPAAAALPATGRRLSQYDAGSIASTVLAIISLTPAPAPAPVPAPAPAS